ncbi:MAG TPA: YdcF family protein, partial [Novosphingobium sp.]|nr:YdcF family protein [Novosphingobium sp.]
ACAATMACCITLGYESVDTRSNAREAANWIAAHHARSLRLVTSDWHMRRAAWELSRTIPADVAVVEDAVPTHPSLNMLMVEYSKYLARRLLRLAHRG